MLMSQEMAVKDLHGMVWQFHHTFSLLWFGTYTMQFHHTFSLLWFCIYTVGLIALLYQHLLHV
jgi:hypothetical protein